MYSRIQALKEQGFSIRQVSRHIRVSRNTIRKYWEMEPDEYAEKYQAINRMSALSAYEGIITKWLESFPNMTSAQVRDWLSENHHLDVPERTVRRYVSKLRISKGISKASEPQREYEAVEELPKGQQLQLDFGVKTARDAYSSRYIKLYFAVFSLTYSRYKWGIFQETSFTSSDLVSALYGCFEYMGGMPRQLVYDQDSIIVVSENNGDILHTQTFTSFLSESKLSVRVCRKSDPETKGLIEAAVKYVKGNFMENRYYMGLDAWNRSFEDWLLRTGNGKKHGTTKRRPSDMFAEEQEHLLPLYGTAPAVIAEGMDRQVRSDNTVLYKSNRYSVPFGTYSIQKEAVLEVSGRQLQIMNSIGEVIATHEICEEKGRLIRHPSHRRDKNKKLKELLEKTISLLGEEFREYITVICEEKPRYAKEQLALVVSTCKAYGRDNTLAAVAYCREQGLQSASDLHDASEMINRQTPKPEAQTGLNPPIPKLLHINNEKYRVQVQKRSLSVYADVSGGSASAGNVSGGNGGAL
jgi:transposase